MDIKLGIGQWDYQGIIPPDEDFDDDDEYYDKTKNKSKKVKFVTCRSKNSIKGQ